MKENKEVKKEKSVGLILYGHHVYSDIDHGGWRKSRDYNSLEPLSQREALALALLLQWPSALDSLLLVL